MNVKSLNIDVRTERGKNAMRRLRSAGFIPGVVYSHGVSEAIKIHTHDFSELFKGKISASVIFDLKYSSGKDTEENMAYVKDYQKDPISGELIHIDLFKVTRGEKIHTNIQVELAGTAPGIKMGGVLEYEIREIEVECLPRDLPEKIIVDISNLEINDSIHVKDLNIGEGIKILMNLDAPIVSVHEPRKIEEEVTEEEIELEEGEEAAQDTEASDEAEAAKENK